MVRNACFYPYRWILRAVQLGILTGCDQPECVPDIEEIATNSLVYLTIECGVAATNGSLAAV